MSIAFADAWGEIVCDETDNFWFPCAEDPNTLIDTFVALATLIRVKKDMSDSRVLVHCNAGINRSYQGVKLYAYYCEGDEGLMKVYFHKGATPNEVKKNTCEAFRNTFLPTCLKMENL